MARAVCAVPWAVGPHDPMQCPAEESRSPRATRGSFATNKRVRGGAVLPGRGRRRPPLRRASPFSSPKSVLRLEQCSQKTVFYLHGQKRGCSEGAPPSRFHPSCVHLPSPPVSRLQLLAEAVRRTGADAAGTAVRRHRTPTAPVPTLLTARGSLSRRVPIHRLQLQVQVQLPLLRCAATVHTVAHAHTHTHTHTRAHGDRVSP